MSVKIRVSEEFHEYLKTLIKEYRKETSLNISTSQATSIILRQLRGQTININITTKGLINKTVKTAIKDFWG